MLVCLRDSHGTTSAQMVSEIDAFHECMRENERERNVRNDVGDQWREGNGTTRNSITIYLSVCGGHKYTTLRGQPRNESIIAYVEGGDSRFSSDERQCEMKRREGGDTVDHSAIAACARLLFSSIAS